jgi:hypothetical protein
MFAHMLRLMEMEPRNKDASQERPWAMPKHEKKVEQTPVEGLKFDVQTNLDNDFANFIYCAKNSSGTSLNEEGIISTIPDWY